MRWSATASMAGPSASKPFEALRAAPRSRARRNTPLYRLKTPSRAGSRLCSLGFPKDWIRSRGLAGRRALGKPPSPAFLTREGSHAQRLHEHSFCHLWLPHIQLDELRTRLRCASKVLWLWLAIDPCTKLLPVLSLGPRTQHAAHGVIHSLRHLLAPGCIPLFTSDGLNLYFYAARGSFWTLAPSEWERAERASVAGGSTPDLRPSEEKLPTTQAGTGDTCDAPWHTGRSLNRLTEVGLLRPAEHRFYRAGQSDGPPWNSCAGLYGLPSS